MCSLSAFEKVHSSTLTMSERDALLRLCSELSLPTVGTLPSIRKRVADTLLTNALAGLESQPSARVVKKRRINPWHEFMKEEKPRLLAAGWAKGTLLTELRRLWHAKKNTPTTTPLLLTYISDDADEPSVDVLTEALYQWPIASLKAELALHGHPTDGPKPQLVSALASAMLAL